MIHDRTRFADPAACRAVLLECLALSEPGAWMPLAEVRDRTRWPTESGNGQKELISTVKSAVRDGLIEFKSGATSGLASVRLKVEAIESE